MHLAVINKIKSFNIGNFVKYKIIYKYIVVLKIMNFVTQTLTQLGSNRRDYFKIDCAWSLVCLECLFFNCLEFLLLLLTGGRGGVSLFCNMLTVLYSVVAFICMAKSSLSNQLQGNVSLKKSWTIFKNVDSNINFRIGDCSF